MRFPPVPFGKFYCSFGKFSPHGRVCVICLDSQTEDKEEVSVWQKIGLWKSTPRMWSV